MANKTPQRKTIIQLEEEFEDMHAFNDTIDITTDQQVFLSGNKALAVMHQRSLKEEGQVESIKVK